MFGRRFPLLRLFGFQVRADAGWLIIALFVTWSLALGAFPAIVPGLSAGVYWVMGFVGAMGLFASILLHEVSHALVARRYGLETRFITLWLFGGVAETVSEPPSALVELRVALAGPLCSFLLAIAAMALGLAVDYAGLPVAVASLLVYLGWMNLVLAIFNMLPGFPLDGGRVLRAILWQVRGDLYSATRAASRVGQGIGIFLMAAGVLVGLGGNLLGALWWILIGSFLRRAAVSSMQQLDIQRVLEGVAVHRVMDRVPLVVSQSLSLERFVQDYAFVRGRMRFPVTQGDQLVGYVDVADVRAIPEADWPVRTVESVARPPSPSAVIDPDANGAEALRRMQEADATTLLVASDGRLEGVVTLDDLVRILGVKSTLEGGTRLAALRAQELRR
ncbi:MAG: site-2 protease family protein [Pseudomonadota bacterium]|nr:site-2 protease family protein [Pseudomonadota bacterium]